MAGGPGKTQNGEPAGPCITTGDARARLAACRAVQAGSLGLNVVGVNI
jgi:hypothetical protein